MANSDWNRNLEVIFIIIYIYTKFQISIIYYKKYLHFCFNNKLKKIIYLIHFSSIDTSIVKLFDGAGNAKNHLIFNWCWRVTSFFPCKNQTVDMN